MDTETTLEFLKLFAAEIRRIQAVDPSLKPLAPLGQAFETDS